MVKFRDYEVASVVDGVLYFAISVADGKKVALVSHPHDDDAATLNWFNKFTCPTSCYPTYVTGKVSGSDTLIYVAFVEPRKTSSTNKVYTSIAVFNANGNDKWVIWTDVGTYTRTDYEEIRGIFFLTSTHTMLVMG